MCPQLKGIIWTLLSFSNLGHFFFPTTIFYFFEITLQYCIGFEIHQHESTRGIHVFPILNPPPNLAPPTISLGRLSAPAPSIQYQASNLD